MTMNGSTKIFKKYLRALEQTEYMISLTYAVLTTANFFLILEIRNHQITCALAQYENKHINTIYGVLFLFHYCFIHKNIASLSYLTSFSLTYSNLSTHSQIWNLLIQKLNCLLRNHGLISGSDQLFYSEALMNQCWPDVKPLDRVME